MKVSIVLTERKYHECVIDGEDYGRFSNGGKMVMPKLSNERAEKILHYLDNNSKRFTGLKIGNHYYKRTFVKFSSEFDYIDVFVAVFDAKEVEKHKKAFSEEDDITIMV